MTTTPTLRWPTTKHLFWISVILAVPIVYWLSYVIFTAEATGGRLTPIEPPASVQLLMWWWMLGLGYFVATWALMTLVIWPLLGFIVSPMLRWMTETVVAIFPNRAEWDRDDSV